MFFHSHASVYVQANRISWSFFDFSPLNKKYFQLKFQPANYDGDSDNIRNNDAEDVEQEDSITQTMA